MEQFPRVKNKSASKDHGPRKPGGGSMTSEATGKVDAHARTQHLCKWPQLQCATDSIYIWKEGDRRVGSETWT